MYLPEQTYELVRASVPIASVDLLPWRETDDGEREVLLIRRLDRRGSPCWCWIGGRIHIDEPIAEAARRHIAETVGTDLVTEPIVASHPDLVVEYQRTPRDDGPYDESQHSIGLTYLVETSGGELDPGGEALEARWFPCADLPEDDDFSFGQASSIRGLALRAGA